MRKQWRASLKLLQQYWQGYGRFKSLLHSPYFHIAIALTLITVGFWKDNAWWEHNLSILPNLLGFTLGGLAVFLCLGTEDLKIAMMQSNDGDATTSPYMKVISSFVHFSIIQTLAIIIGILANAASLTSKPNFVCDSINNFLGFIIGLVGYGLFFYSLLLAIALTLSIYKMSSLSTQAIQKALKTNNQNN